ncbi:serine hydrolase domain-containing protein [Deinococcus maricopensis]|uniref:Beta-lactamase n=1 Tax=Deinococcus maricopensis (strain DSM 21211 / LMG 22137 / NRRL B-23946 / LB-34) TaxID=709986 RepID=E8U3A1_DEIML|nr:serine hydrolase domain-containing protein [Deinococcus maricopensis]ADV66046.1 beta-lactamase [Deinococcus maricopensis DSM 21211]
MPHLTPDLLARLSQTRHVPGMAVAAQVGHDTQHLSYGVADLETGRAMDAATTFPIGSITKTMTATLALQLRDAGQLDLDALVATFLPGLPLEDPDTARTLTVRHLLTHTAGFGPPQRLAPSGDMTLATVVSRLSTITQRKPVGTYSYSDVAYLLVGRIIELITARPFEEVLRERLLRPVGLAHARFLHEPPTPGTHPAWGYVLTPDQTLARYNGPTYGPYVAPTGGLRLTVQEILTYLQFVLRGSVTATGEALLSASSAQELLTPVSPLERGRTRTLAWEVESSGEQLVYKQRCSLMGIHGVAFIVPERQRAGVVFNNALHGLHAEVEVSRVLLE